MLLHKGRSCRRAQVVSDLGDLPFQEQHCVGGVAQLSDALVSPGEG
jgi:hypothetical protein